MSDKAGPAEKYALFQNKFHSEIRCAVRLGLGAPDFIKQNWVYQEVISIPATVPINFDLLKARHSIRLNGYYIFMTPIC
jgi:hypothetical protein